ncbi:DNA polymerase beta superfamily protein [Streptomyces sp. CA-250714]|uniref:DNA polymerase beta superfamily protein n=1 Tax=Streptomyces sp. CA-250714 TaxID=3240060 RepID=UPI003D949BB7
MRGAPARRLRAAGCVVVARAVPRAPDGARSPFCAWAVCARGAGWASAAPRCRVRKRRRGVIRRAVLHSPLVERCTPLGAELRGLAGSFLSRDVHRTYARFAQAQLARAENRRRRSGEVRWKQMMHLIRLLLDGAALLRTGTLTLDAGEYRERLLAVRHGERSWEETVGWAEQLTRRLDDALATSPLPAEPDRARVEDWLISVRRRCLSEEGAHRT